jgi:cysteine-rich repeat protein
VYTRTGTRLPEILVATAFAGCVSVTRSAFASSFFALPRNANHGSDDYLCVCVYLSSIFRSTKIHKDSLVDRDAKPLDHDGFRAGFVFLDDNDEGYFLHGSDKIEAKKGSFITFEGHVEHQTIIPAGAKNPIHLLFPFTLTTERSLSLVGRFERVCGDGRVNSQGLDIEPSSSDDEERDDGNNVNGDGCSADCKLEASTPSGGGSQGDPRFKTWRGKHFDYHGECDLVLLHSSAFESGLGLDVYIRTKIRRDMSYISSAASAWAPMFSKSIVRESIT